MACNDLVLHEIFNQTVTDFAIYQKGPNMSLVISWFIVIIVFFYLLYKEVNRLWHETNFSLITG